jgi:hypothetical protein
MMNHTNLSLNAQQQKFPLFGLFGLEREPDEDTPHRQVVRAIPGDIPIVRNNVSDAQNRAG